MVMQITAQLNNLRISPRKVRLVARAVRGMNAIVAKYQLEYIIKKSSKPISRLLDSALANAHNNFNLLKDNLFIKDIVVNEGPKLKRFRPKGFGMASPIEKKTSRVKIVLEEKVRGLKANQESRVSIHETEREAAIQESEKPIIDNKIKPEVKKSPPAGGGKKSGAFGKMSGLGRKFFRRKAI